MKSEKGKMQQVEVYDRIKKLQESSDRSKDVKKQLEDVFKNIKGDEFKKGVVIEFLQTAYEQYFLGAISNIDLSALISEAIKKENIPEDTKRILKHFKEGLLNNKKKDDEVSRGVRNIDRQSYEQMLECINIIIDYTNDSHGAVFSRELLMRIIDTMETIRQHMIAPGQNSEQIISSCVENVAEFLKSILKDTIYRSYLQNRSVELIGENNHSLNIFGNAISRLFGFFRMLINSIRTQNNEERRDLINFVEYVIDGAELLKHTRSKVIEKIIDQEWNSAASEDDYVIECNISSLIKSIEDEGNKLSDNKKKELKGALLRLILRNMDKISFDKNNKNKINVDKSKVEKLFGYVFDFKDIQDKEVGNFVSVVDQLVANSTGNSSHKKYNKLDTVNADIGNIQNRIDNLDQFANIITDKNTQIYKEFIRNKNNLDKELERLKKLLKKLEGEAYELQMIQAKNAYKKNQYKKNYKYNNNSSDSDSENSVHTMRETIRKKVCVKSKEKGKN